jgi:Fic family protein
MADDQPDIEPDIKADMDRGESVGLMEPMQLDEGGRARGEALELAFELAKKSAGFKRSLPAPILESLSALVRSMNCYYSNLIEGHDTHPIDIERALDNDYSGDPRKRELQIEAKAHIAVQEWIDAGGLSGRGATGHAACEIHRRFYEEMPEDLCWAENPDTGERIRVVPGGFRRHDVKVGRHVAISPGAVPRFMERFDEAYGGLSATAITVAAAAAHHRLAWIHPFTDGNGRVGRLMSHAILLDSVDSGGLWSVSRGLARRVGDYKMHLANCDQPRRNSLDGRGSLSQEALADFTRFFLKMCLDQVTFMEELIEPARLRRRIEIWFEEEVRLGNLPQKAGIILSAILYRGELPRGEMDGLLGLTDRQSRRIVRPLFELGVLTSQSTRAPIRLAFPATLAGRWVPGLFPEKPATEPGS